MAVLDYIAGDKKKMPFFSWYMGLPLVKMWLCLIQGEGEQNFKKLCPPSEKNEMTSLIVTHG